MRLDTEKRDVVSNGVMTSTHFGIDLSSQVHLIRILRDRLYSDKVLAVLREYGANAWDAHREKGIPEVPIKVVVPTQWESSLIIRDYGPGLSEEGVYKVFVMYGASTKRDSNDGVGMFGIGAKSAFAYNDSFTVTSYNGGRKTIYFAVLDETDIGTMSKVYEAVLGKYINAALELGPPESFPPNDYIEFRTTLEPAEVERLLEKLPEVSRDAETGIEVKIPVLAKDFVEFRQKAERLFSYFDPQPVINIPLHDPYEGNGRVSHLHRTHGRWVAVMGCIGYEFDRNSLREELTSKYGDLSMSERFSCRLVFDVGALDIAATRESLEFTEKTKKALIHEINMLIEREYSTVYAELIGKSGWEKRILVTGFATRTGLPIPADLKTYAAHDVRLPDSDLYRLSLVRPGYKKGGYTVIESPDCEYTVSARRGVAVGVTSTPKIYVRDTTRPLRGYAEMYGYDPYIAFCSNIDGVPADPVAVRDEILKALKDAEADGVEVILMSTLDYDPKRGTPPPSVANEKHKRKYFTAVLSGAKPFAESARWTISNDIPAGTTDPVVVIYEFVPTEVKGFLKNDYYKRVIDDFDLVETVLEEPRPKLHGVKKSAKSPITQAELKEKHGFLSYEEWSTALFERCKTHQKVQALVETAEWAKCGELRLRGEGLDKAAAEAERTLGLGHPLATLFKRVSEAELEMLGLDEIRRKTVTRFTEKLEVGGNAADKAATELLQKYPLFRREHGGPGLEIFASKQAEVWADYIKLVDSQEAE